MVSKAPFIRVALMDTFLLIPDSTRNRANRLLPKSTKAVDECCWIAALGKIMPSEVSLQPFMDREIRFRSRSTSTTVTHTCCCTLTISEGFLTNRSANWLM